MKTAWVKNKDVNLWTESFGDSKDPALLLIIGAGAVSTFFPDFFCKALAEQGYFVIRYDQRDYGKSSHFSQVPPDVSKDIDVLKESLPYRIDDFVVDALAILDHYEVEKAYIAGHSMGGMIAQILSVTYHERVQKIISMSVGPASPHAKIEPIPEDTMKILYANQPQGNLEKDKAGWTASFRLLNGDVPFAKALAMEYLEEIYVRDPHAGVAWNHIGVQQFLPDYDDNFKASQIPTLIFHGEKDSIQPVSYVQAVQKLIPRAQAIVIPSFGHMFFNKGAWNTIHDAFIEFLG